MSIILNEHINLNTTISKSFDRFTPDNGYALWTDDEIGNLDSETGEPYCYWMCINTPKSKTEARASHIWAKLIDETMEVLGKIDGSTAQIEYTEATEADYQNALAEMGVNLNG